MHASVLKSWYTTSAFMLQFTKFTESRMAIKGSEHATPQYATLAYGLF